MWGGRDPLFDQGGGEEGFLSLKKKKVQGRHFAKVHTQEKRLKRFLTLYKTKGEKRHHQKKKRREKDQPEARSVKNSSEKEGERGLLRRISRTLSCLFRKKKAKLNPTHRKKKNLETFLRSPSNTHEGENTHFSCAVKEGRSGMPRAEGRKKKESRLPGEKTTKKRQSRHTVCTLVKRTAGERGKEGRCRNGCHRSGYSANRV